MDAASPGVRKGGWTRLRIPSGGLARRAGWGIADQTVSSLTNFALVIVVAHESSTHVFGLFALAFATYSLALGCCRALYSEPIVVRYSDVPESIWRSGAAMATGGALATGVILGVVCVVIGLVAGGEATALFVILGLMLPGLLLQDTWRYSFFAAKRGSNAFVNDTICALLLLPALAAFLAVGHVSAAMALAFWGAAATIAALVGVAQAGLLPNPWQISKWWRRQSDLAPRYLAEFVAVAGESQVVLYGIALITGLTAVAAIRGGLLLLGPLNILVFGATMSGVPEAVRLLRSGVGRLIIACIAISAGLVALSAVWAGVLLVIPSSLGSSIVGPVWYSARPLVLPLAIGTAALGVVIGAAIGLRALEAAPKSLRARLIVSPVILGGGLIGAALAGAAGGAWGLAIGQSVAAVVFWYYFIGAVVDRQRDASSARSPTLGRLSDWLQPAVER
jgi:O-antigen/teichoic acid export membrane protein